MTEVKKYEDKMKHDLAKYKTALQQRDLESKDIKKQIMTL